MYIYGRLLKIGPATVKWATIRGVTLQHKISPSSKYEIKYASDTAVATPEDSQGENPDDYVWEYVATCNAQTQPCDRTQVPSFYLRKCPQGTQMINSTAGSTDFDAVSQMCLPFIFPESCAPNLSFFFTVIMQLFQCKTR